MRFKDESLLFAPTRPLLLILWLTFALRVWQLGAQSLWYDEAVSLFIAQQSIPDLLAHTAGDIHPPLYYVLLHYWLAWAGTSEFTAAYFSLFFGVLLVALSFRLARDAFGTPVGVLTAFLLSVSSFNLWYAQEVRMYTLVACLVVCSCYLLLRLLSFSSARTAPPTRRERWRWFGARIGVACLYALVVALGLYTHYYFGFLWVAHYLLVAVYWVGHQMARWQRAPSSFVAVEPTTTPSAFGAPETLAAASSHSIAATGNDSRWSLMRARLTPPAQRLKARLSPLRARIAPFNERLRARLAFVMEQAKPIMQRIKMLRRSASPWLARVWHSPFFYWQWVQVFVVVLFAPWLPIAYRQVTDPPVPPWRSSVAWQTALSETLTALAIGQGFSPTQGWFFVWLVCGLTLWGSFTHLHLFAPYRARFKLAPASKQLTRFGWERLAVWVVCVSAVAPFVLMLAASSWTPLYHMRYTYIVAAPFYVVVALGLAALGRHSVLTLVVLLGIFTGGTLYADYERRTAPTYAKDDYRTAVNFIAERARPGDAILINAGYIYPTFVYYFPFTVDWRGRLSDYRGDETAQSIVVAQTGSLQATTHLGWNSPTSDFYVTDEATTARALELLLQKHPRLWQLRANDTVNDPQGFIRQYLQARTMVFDEITVTGESHVKAQGLLLTGANPTVFTPTYPLSVTWGERVTLLGWSGMSTITAGHALKVSLFWQVQAPLDVDYHVSLRLLDSRGRRWAQLDGMPVGAALPMVEWPLKQTMPDARNLLVPLGTPPGDYSLQVLLYDPFTHQPLPTPRGIEGVRVSLGQIQVARNTNHAPSPEPEARVRSHAVFDNGIALYGYDVSTEQVKPGEVIHAELVWHTRRAPPNDQQVFVQLLDERGRSWVMQEATPVEGRYPTSQWSAGEYVRDVRDVLVPPEAPDGTYRVMVGWTRGHSRERVPVRDGWWLWQSDSYELARIAIKGREHLLKAPTTISTPLRARFGESVSLIGYDITTTPLTATRTLTLTLYWQALSQMTTNYKVFAHLVGPNEQIITQRDAEPGNGTSPTTSWLEGEYLTDPYALDLPTSMPAGDYNVYIGLYDPSTNTRLPIFDGEGKPLSDRLLLHRIALR
jgi:hypothetical protein